MPSEGVRGRPLRPCRQPEEKCAGHPAEIESAVRHARSAERRGPDYTAGMAEIASVPKLKTDVAEAVEKAREAKAGELKWKVACKAEEQEKKAAQWEASKAEVQRRIAVTAMQKAERGLEESKETTRLSNESATAAKATLRVANAAHTAALADAVEEHKEAMMAVQADAAAQVARVEQAATAAAAAAADNLQILKAAQDALQCIAG